MQITSLMFDSFLFLSVTLCLRVSVLNSAMSRIEKR